MKKIIALALCLVTVLSLFAGCGDGIDKNDKGETIPLYLTDEISNFDPAYANLDDATMQIMSLLYEGLYKYDANGKVVKAQAKSVKKLDKPSKNYYAIEITLKNTSWSDGTPVLASDYIFAWKRILESDFRGEAANMLFCIKNARAVHNGDATVDDLGITDVSERVLRIEFEGKTDYSLFYEYLASPMLVPLREFRVDRFEKYWSSTPMNMVSNGPFKIRSYKFGEQLILERNDRYYRKNSDAFMKKVTPFRLEINYGVSPEEAYEAYKNGEIVFSSSLPLSKRAEILNSEKVTVKDSLSVKSVIFNTQNGALADADVRNALSLALDRNEIVKILTFAKAAEGLIADGVFETSNGKKKATFRDKGEALISASANESEAKKLLNGKEKGDINLVIRDNEADEAVADYIKGVWNKLGFNVTVTVKEMEEIEVEDMALVRDTYYDAYESRDFDAILVDYMMFSSDAFGNLASFSKYFAGGAMDMNVADGNYQLATHISGYDNADYDAIIEKAYKESDAKKRAGYLHEAEKMLMSDMPICPLVQLQSACVKNSDLTKLKTDYFGNFNFVKAKLKNPDKYTSASAE